MYLNCKKKISKFIHSFNFKNLYDLNTVNTAENKKWLLNYQMSQNFYVKKYIYICIL